MSKLDEPGRLVFQERRPRPAHPVRHHRDDRRHHPRARQSQRRCAAGGWKMRGGGCSIGVGGKRRCAAFVLVAHSVQGQVARLRRVAQFGALTHGSPPTSAAPYPPPPRTVAAVCLRRRCVQKSSRLPARCGSRTLMRVWSARGRVSARRIVANNPIPVADGCTGVPSSEWRRQLVTSPIRATHGCRGLRFRRRLLMAVASQVETRGGRATRRNGRGWPACLVVASLSAHWALSLWQSLGEDVDRGASSMGTGDGSTIDYTGC